MLRAGKGRKKSPPKRGAPAQGCWIKDPLPQLGRAPGCARRKKKEKELRSGLRTGLPLNAPHLFCQGICGLKGEPRWSVGAKVAPLAPKNPGPRKSRRPQKSWRCCYRILMSALLMSSRKVARPLSVSGWLARDLITAGGAVITSAPIRALSRIWLAERIEAARISVSKP